MLVEEDKKNNPSVERPIYLTVQTLQYDFLGGFLAQVLRPMQLSDTEGGAGHFPGKNISLLLF